MLVEKPNNIVIEQDESNHSFDSVHVRRMLDYFGGDRTKLVQYLTKKNEQDALWRVQNYRPSDIADEIEDFEATKEEVEKRIKKLQEQQELREQDEWSDWTLAHALFDYLCSEDELDPEIDDVYSMYYETYTDNNFPRFEVGIKEWQICTSEAAKQKAIENVKNTIETEGAKSFNKEFVERFIDGDEVANDMDIDSDVRNNPEAYLDNSDKELSSYQEDEIREKREQLEGLEEERDNLDTDTPEGEERYEEIQEEINNLESEIEDIENDPDGDYKEEAIERIVEEKENEIKNNPLQYLKDLGYTEFSQWIDEDEMAEAAVEEDGVGHFLSGYDGQEREHTYNGENFSIFRQN
jgi:DNA repair exonuclease SbcCD ATPase subunit